MSKAKPTTAQAVALPMPAFPALPSPLTPEQGLRRYLQEISRYPLLTPTEEFELSKRWRDEGDVAAAHRLVTSHLRLVAKLAMRYRGYGLPVAELIAEGNIGMMQAVKRFEPDKGFRLATYAIWWIKAAIQEYILRSWSLVKIGSSAAQKRLFFNLRKTKRKIGAVHGVELTDAQIADIAQQLDVSTRDVVDMDRRMNAVDVFLNAPVAGSDGESEKMDFLADTSESHETVLAEKQEKRNRRNSLIAAMSKLTKRERDILQKRRLQDEPVTLEDLSQVYQISRERVRQIEVRAFEKLQKEMTADAKAA
jgi:RNA polymerase sigma-32 factor